MQTNLEKKGIEARNDLIVRNDYSKVEEYSQRHPDALADGDVMGKGTGHGGHTHSVPDSTKPSAISYANFDTSNRGGGAYDVVGRNGIGGRDFLKNISLYNENNEYGAHLIDTRENISDGQVRI